MDDEKKVFYSNVSRTEGDPKNNLYDLIDTSPVEPIVHQKNNVTAFKFTPNNENKIFDIPRNKYPVRVKTVRDIKNIFEADVYSYLMDDLQKQQKFLLRKIRDGSSYHENTKNVARRILHSDQPVSRSAWQMIVNINPESVNQPKQFILWNGRRIWINGSRGGNSKCIYSKTNISLQTKKLSPNNAFKRKPGLLRNSLAVQFKPGPLSKKCNLDVSHHKHQMGRIELINIPKPAIDITPVYGSVLDPTVTSFINNLRNENGIISKKWAQFSLSVLGAFKSQVPEQIEKEVITFGLTYKNDQNRLIMRRDVEHVDNQMNVTCQQICEENNLTQMYQIRQVINGVLDAVEISLQQDLIYSIDEDDYHTSKENKTPEPLAIIKEKTKRKFSELGRLDVTVIKLPETQQYNESCHKPHCILGCVCHSLDSPFRLKQHCGLIDCMFGCICKIPKYHNLPLLRSEYSEMIPGMLTDKLTGRLAKEEQKFHQTVIVTGDKSILLESERRTLKSTKQYKEFYKHLNLRPKNTFNKILRIVESKLNCQNIEPWCMVHNLYKCFCQGKFTESSIYEKPGSEELKDKGLEGMKDKRSEGMKDKRSEGIKDKRSEGMKDKRSEGMKDTQSQEIKDKSEEIRDSEIPKVNYKDEFDNTRLSLRSAKQTRNVAPSHMIDKIVDMDIYSRCARTTAYSGRKFTNGYYKYTNQKIFELEKNDKLLKEKMSRIVNFSHGYDLQNVTNLSTDNQADIINVGSDVVTSSRTELLQETQSNPDIHKVTTAETEVGGQSDQELCNEILFTNEEVIASNQNIEAPEQVDCEDITDSYTRDEKIIQSFFKCSGEEKNFITWIEAAYKIYKKRVSQGLQKTSLEAPKKGKIILLSWDFLLSRYKERKNFVLVTKDKPFKIYICVDQTHPSFKNCINIDDICFADLPKYPHTIRNILTGASNIEHFCIFGAREICWELVGYVAKKGIDETISIQSPQENKNPELRNETSPLKSSSDSWYSQDVFAQHSETSIPNSQHLRSDRSKWFLMTVENDFTEIQFFEKGFYVKYDSIMRSINLARFSKKVVRLCCCSDSKEEPQFGLYATPNEKECSILVGPYEVHDSLGVWSVKKIIANDMRKTRGIWIYTDKVDDMSVINDPLSFMPPRPPQEDAMVTLDSRSDCLSASCNTSKTNQKYPNDSKRTVKPIYINRSSGFYKLLPIKNPVSNSAGGTPILLKNLNELPYSKPVAEVAPQIKITSVFSQNKQVFQQNLIDNLTNRSLVNQREMIVLKPTQINEKAIGLLPNVNTCSENSPGPDTSLEVENFIESSSICEAPDDVFVISDDEEKKPFKTVWIECTIVEFGWIPGQALGDKISFKYPGFKYSPFYTKDEAITKINQVLARKMFMPEQCKLDWRIVDSEKKLSSSQLPNDPEKTYLLQKLIKYSFKSKKFSSSEDPTSAHSSKESDIEMKTTMKDLKETDNKLEEESDILWNSACAMFNENATLNIKSEQKPQMLETLKGIVSLNSTP